MLRPVRRLSLIECWKSGCSDLIPEARSFKNMILAFIDRKACNTVFSQPYQLNFVQKFEINFWSWLEMNTRKFWQREMPTGLYYRRHRI